MRKMKENGKHLICLKLKIYETSKKKIVSFFSTIFIEKLKYIFMYKDWEITQNERTEKNIKKNIRLLNNKMDWS